MKYILIAGIMMIAGCATSGVKHIQVKCAQVEGHPDEFVCEEP